LEAPVRRHLPLVFAIVLWTGCSSGDDLSSPNGTPGAPRPEGQPPRSTPSSTNQVPVANADTFRVAPGTTLVATAPGILANDSDPNGDPLTAFPDSVAWAPPNPSGLVPEDQSLTLAGGVITGWDTHGGFTYTPTAGFTGTEVLFYRAYEDVDGGLVSDRAVVVIVVE
jgi:hypothetical protein